jgi:hypothetical protein
VDACGAANMRFPVGHDLTEPIRNACLAVPNRRWRPAISANGSDNATAPMWPRSPTSSTSVVGPSAPGRSPAAKYPALAPSSPSPTSTASARVTKRGARRAEQSTLPWPIEHLPTTTKHTRRTYQPREPHNQVLHAQGGSPWTNLLPGAKRQREFHASTRKRRSRAVC